MSGKGPTRTELARIKVMHELVVPLRSSAAMLGRSHNTVIEYLKSDVCNNPKISQMVARIREADLSDLYLFGAKGRQRLHELLDWGDSPMIPTIALVERAFQQRRLFGGKSTSNVSSLTAAIQAVARENT